MNNLNKHLNIVAFDVPFPPNYGGAVDLFYKIKYLHNLGIKIHLHVFEYGRGKPKELNFYCEKIYYYKRNNPILSQFSIIPYLVKSRSNKELLKNLRTSDYPILFEGLHTTDYIKKVNVKTYVRTHNIEHEFYYGLAKSEKNGFKKIFYYIEGFKLKLYEKKINNTHGIFTISKLEQEYFKSIFGEKTKYIPAFHNNEFKAPIYEKEKYILWHGNLNISDNKKAVIYLINIIKNTHFKLKIVSSFKNKNIIKIINKFPNICFVYIDHKTNLEKLIQGAHINILLSYQVSGIKLKLLYSLYRGKFIIVNNQMIEKTGLENLCEIANNKKEILDKIHQLIDKEFTPDYIKERKKVLQSFDSKKSAQKIIDIIFKN